MKKGITRLISCALAVVLLFSCLGIGVFAASGADFDNAIPVISGSTFTVHVSESKPVAYYKLAPTASGYFEISSDNLNDNSIDPFLSLYNGDKELIEEYDDDHDSFDFNAKVYLTAGETYYLKMINLSESKAVSYSVTINYLGEITSISVDTLPNKIFYILGYDDNKYYLGNEYFMHDDRTFIDSLLPKDFIYEDFFEYYREFGSYPGLSDELCDCLIGNCTNQDHIAFFPDLNGLAVNVEFSANAPILFESYDVYSINLDISIGEFKKGPLTITIGNGNIYDSFEIEVIDNPVESFELVTPPEQTVYTYGVDGSYYIESFFNRFFTPYINLNGAQFRINYTDGTSEVVTFDSEVWLYGKYQTYIFVYTETVHLFSNTLTVSYMLNETEVEYFVVLPNIFTLIYLIFFYWVDWIY